MKQNKSTKKIISIETSYGSHRVIFEPDERKGYVAVAPDLQGVITWGKNLTEAKRMIREAIELCVESMAEAKIAAEKVLVSAPARRIRERALA